jgi:hypothetical protein
MDNTYDAEKRSDWWTYQFHEQRHAADAIARSRAIVLDKPALPTPEDEPAVKDNGER